MAYSVENMVIMILVVCMCCCTLQIYGMVIYLQFCWLLIVYYF